MNESNYLMEYETLVSIIDSRVKCKTFKKVLSETILRIQYDNKYGKINGEDGINSEFNYSYPKYLVPEDTKIPIGTYGFVNLDATKKYRTYEEMGEDEYFDYSKVKFNVEDYKKDDLILFIEEVIDEIINTSDFTLVEYSHSIDVWKDWRSKYKVEGETIEKTAPLYIISSLKM